MTLPFLRSEMVASTFRRSLVDLFSRSSLVPGERLPPRDAAAFASMERSVFAPDCFSLNIPSRPCLTWVYPSESPS
jgi:hypothetical protein